MRLNNSAIKNGINDAPKKKHPEAVPNDVALVCFEAVKVTVVTRELMFTCKPPLMKIDPITNGNRFTPPRKITIAPKRMNKRPM